MASTHARFIQDIEIKDSDIDIVGHVNNIVYLRWVQNIAVAHWGAQAHPEDQARLLWVVIRHEIDYKHQCFRDDTLRAETWVGPASRLAFERNTEIIRHKDGRDQLVARARTVWCPIDRRRGRPCEVGERVRAHFSTGESEKVI